MIDVHAHLNLLEGKAPWRELFERSRQKGVTAFVVPGADLESSQKAVELAEQDPQRLFAAVGLHPNHIAPNQPVTPGLRLPEDDVSEVFNYDAYVALAKKPQVVAIGEVGLDRYRSPQSMEEQLEVFRQFVDLALEVDKPMILHVRAGKTPKDDMADGNPHDVMIELLEKLETKPRFLVHCYQGTPDQAQKYLALGGFISFTGTITYSDDAVVTYAIKLVPADRLLAETDTPFLSPVPYRGEMNEPWKVAAVIDRLAQVRGVSTTEIEQLTTANAKSFFALPEDIV